jgi:hypothetical protein
MGGVFFGEEKVAERLFGSLIMMAGVAMIGIWG